MPEPFEATPLAAVLAARIRRDGPLSVGDYIAACLGDPLHGYYTTRAGAGGQGIGGDFVTAPEISQVFGELLGLWAAVVWQQMGQPAAVRLVEWGPGRGTAMRDALRATRRVPGFHAALRVTLVEIGAPLRVLQQATLADAPVAVSWATEIADSVGPTIVLANEFLDCLPVRQFVRGAEGWLERMVTLDGAGRLAFTTGALNAPLPDLPATAPAGSLVERTDYGPLARSLAAGAGPFAALFVDYGDAIPADRRFGDTLQAVRDHAFEPVLAAPGMADLTAQVDFGAAARAFAGAGLAIDGPVSQATLLGRLGAVERASRLMAANPAAAARLEGEVARLLAPAGMGGRFQALGVRSPGLPPLPGFADAAAERGMP